MRYPRRALLVTLVVTALVAGALYGMPPGEDDDVVLPTEEELMQPSDAGTYLWPYTSRSRSTEGRTLALNVIVYGDPDRTRRALEYRSETNWTSVEDNVTIAPSDWQPVRGASRYTYVSVEPNITGRWFESEYQLGTGTYLGRRTHIRAYPAPSNNWTAFQAHTEYWDWLRLRHTVTGVEAGARFLERDLRDEPFVERISREYHGLGGGGSDGWITLVEFVPGVVAAGALAAVVPAAQRRRELFRDAILPASLAGLVLSVRTTGIALEGAFPWMNPKLFAGMLYPLMVAGPLILTGTFARDRAASKTAVLAAAGLGAGIVLDLGAVRAMSVSVRFALHRVALVSALGLFALGVARADRRTVAIGLVAWVVTLGLPLFGIV